MRIRYTRWSGTQEPFPPDLSAESVMDAMSEDLLEGWSPDQALGRLLRQGIQGRVSGLADLRRRVEEARRRELGRMGLEGPLREVEERLAEILERERTALDFSADDLAAQVRREELDALPGDIAGKLSALERYDWMDRRAGEDFRELLDSLRRDVAQATFGRLAQALGNMTEADLGRMRDMLAELNGMIAKREAGQDVTGDFAAFKERYRDVLPGDPQNLDELLEELARRMAAMSRMMAGLDPDQRAQLAAMSRQLLGGDADLAFQAGQLRRALEGAYPELGWDEGMGGMQPSGAESGSLSETVDWVEHLQEMEDLGRALGQDYPGARLEDIDEDALRRTAGQEAADQLRALREIERILEEAGAAQRHHGRMELTARGIRQLGERSLARIYSRLVDGAVGSHRVVSGGGEGEPTGTTRPFRFGDPFRIDITRTVHNAVRRGGAPAGAVRLAPEDFELAEAERRVRTSTVLLLDMSFSMPLRGNWGPAKRVALALHSLIASQYPEDRFHVVGFSDYARRLQSRDLLVTGWERVYGTNMQHAFMLARRLLADRPGDEKQVIMITDGEPTAHLEGDLAYFSWPPEAETLRLTLAEAGRLARTGATLNVFLLDHDPGAAVFVEKMAAMFRGRVFYPDLEDLGRLVVRDFLTGRPG